jgi:hypothetical protein
MQPRQRHRKVDFDVQTSRSSVAPIADGTPHDINVDIARIGCDVDLSVVGWPIDGAGDGVKMVTSGLLSECYLPIFRARLRHHLLFSLFDASQER